VGLIGRGLLCKLRAQITFGLNGTADLKLRGPEAKTLTLMVPQEGNGGSMPLKEGLLRFPSFLSRF
jgi:hypothetical protein